MVQSDRVKAVLKELEYKTVSIPQSMYIFKQARLYKLYHTESDY